MAFSFLAPRRRSPNPRRSSTPFFAKGALLRERVSRIGFFSILLIFYAAISLGLILWNQKQTSSIEPTAEDPAAVNKPPTRSPAPINDPDLKRVQDGSKARRGIYQEGQAGNAEYGNVTMGSTLLRDGLPASSLHGDSRAQGGTQVTAGVPGLEESGRQPKPAQLPEEPKGKPSYQDSTKKGRGMKTRVNPPMDMEFDVTLVSQSSANRFWMLPFLCHRWPGPISIAVLEEESESLGDHKLCSHMNISVTPAQSEEELDPESYPVNRLRNVALRAVQTSHLLMTDIDIWPDKHAYDALHARYELETSRMSHARNAIVFAAFSRQRFCDGDCLKYAEDVPETVMELKPCLETDTCGRFDALNPSGQGTAYVYYWRSMLRKPDKRTLEHIQCFKSHRFEPYLVVRKSSILPEFDERFAGYGKNKIQWINHLRYIGFSFYVMPVNFVIHAAHPKSIAKSKWEKVGGGKQGRGNKPMDIIFDEFMAELKSHEGEGGLITHLCQARRKGAPS